MQTIECKKCVTNLPLDKYYFKMKILNPIPIDPNNDNEQTIGVKINQEMEKIILANPGQWIWTHNRWKV